MAVIIQEVVGEDRGGYYFPSFSGVGRSLNYYTLGEEQPEDGVVEIAIGLGKYIVDGGRGAEILAPCMPNTPFRPRPSTSHFATPRPSFRYQTG